MTTAKEYDDSPPRNGVIFFYTVLTVIVLIAIKFLLDSYFAKTMDDEVHDKVLTRGMEEVREMRAREAAALDPKTLNSAKAVYSRSGRTGVLAPASGQGKPEVQGWTQLGRQVAPPVAPAAPEAPTEPAAPAPGSSPVAPATRPQ